MPVEFSWDDTEQTILRYTAHDAWNWNDYHKAVRMSIFSLLYLGHTVDVIIDLSQSSKVPAGAVGHVRSFAKRHHENFSGHAIVIGLPAEIENTLVGDQSQRKLMLGDQTLHFVDTSAEAQSILQNMPHRSS